MSKVISNLEILLKPIAPRIGQADTDPIARTSVQGYFLTVSNLSDQLLKFNLYATISPNSTIPEYREFTRPLPATLTDPTLVPPPIPNPPPNLSNTNYVIADDIAGGNGFSFFSNRSVLTGGAIKYTTKSFNLPAFHTVSVQILPNVVNDPLRNANELEIRGFVEIDSSLQFGSAGGGGIFLLERYRPAYKVLVTPEYRGTIIPNSTSVNEIDQTAYAVTVAGGDSILSDVRRDFPVVFNPDLISFDRIQKIKRMVKHEKITNEISRLTSQLVRSDKSLEGFEEEIAQGLRNGIMGIE